MPSASSLSEPMVAEVFLFLPAPSRPPTKRLPLASASSERVVSFLTTPLVWPDFVDTASWAGILALTVAAGIGLAILAFIARETIRSSFHNRMFAVVLFVGWLATITAMAGLWIADVSPGAMTSIHPIIWFSGLAVLCGMLDTRLWPSVVCMWAGILIMPSLDRRFALYLVSGVIVFAIANVFWISRESARR